MSIQTNTPSSNLGGGTATTDASLLTSGTLSAALLPGSLANVDTAAELRAAAALDTTDSPQFAGVNIGHASDTTLTRVSAGVVAVEGVTLQNRVANVSDTDIGCIADLATTGGIGHFLKQNSAGGTATSGTIATADLPWPMIIPAGSTTAGANGERWIGPVSGSALAAQVNIPTNGYLDWSVNGVRKGSLGTALFCNNYSSISASADTLFYSQTTDGTDNRQTSMTAGGAVIAPGSVQTRSAAIEMAGNEHTRTGQLSLMAGAVTGGKVVAYDKNAAIALQVDETGVTHAVPVIFTTTQTSAGATISNVWRGSDGSLNLNVPTSALLNITVNGVAQAQFGAGNWNIGTSAGEIQSFGGGIYIDGDSHTFRNKSANLTSASIAVSATGATSIGAGGTGTTLPEVCVYGASHAGSPGAVEVKANSVAQASNATWTSKYSLAKGTHNGRFEIYDTATADMAAAYSITGTTLALVAGGSAEYVASGAENATHIAFRISSGNVQIYVGTSISVRKYAIIYKGTVS